MSQQRPQDSEIYVAKGKPNKKLLIVTGFLILIGVMMILSAGASKCTALGKLPIDFAWKQLISIVVGLFLMKFFANFKYQKLLQYAVPAAWIVVVFLALIDFTPLGVTVNGAKRWIALGPLQFQPSEVTKPAFALLLAGAFRFNSKLFEQEKIVKYFLPCLTMALFTAMQPNLSMVIILFGVSVAMYILAGGSWQILMAAASAGIGLIALKIKPYQLSRIVIWRHPESDPYGAGYNIIQSLLAFVSGGIFGVGYGNSKQKLEWLPEAHTDFIFAVIGEEWGFIGCLGIIWLFGMFVIEGMRISQKAPDMFGKLLAAGLTISIGLQACINMAVSSSAIPATGVPLPFISYGGTSVMVTMGMVGILLNISKYTLRKKHE